MGYLNNSFFLAPNVANKIDLNGLNSYADKLNFNPTTVSALSAIGQVRYSSTSHCLEVMIDSEVTMQIGQEMLFEGKSREAVQMNSGNVVYISGAVGDNPEIKFASNTVQLSAQATIGVVTEVITPNNNGFICSEGIVNGLNTDAYLAGDILWLGANGTFTNIEPVAPIPKIFIGVVLRKQQINGSIYVKIRSVPRFSRLSDVLFTDIKDNDIPVWNATNARFQNSNTTNFKITPEGGYAIKLINNTGLATVKGYAVKVDTALNNSFSNIVVNVPDPIGIIYEAGVANGSPAWIVVAGIADAYFIGNTTRGFLARGFLSADAGYVSGRLLAEALPVAPFATDKHFYELGHVLESRTGAGLAKMVLHFN